MAGYHVENRERIRAYKHSNKARIAEWTAEYRAARADLIAKQKSEWKAANPEINAAHERNRRARIRNSPGSHSAEDIARIFERQRGLCAACHTKLSKSGKNKYHVDHIMPLARGGSNWPMNLQCLCPNCNMSKHSKDPIEWATEIGRLL